MYLSQGKLKYEEKKLIVEIDQGISDYYRSLVPKYLTIKPSLYPAHISVVRREEPNRTHWGKYEGKIVAFYYEPMIHIGQVYYWLNAYSEELENIRQELGLPPHRMNRCFHITIGNKK